MAELKGVAALVPYRGPDQENWILANIVSSNHEKNYYVVEDAATSGKRHAKRWWVPKYKVITSPFTGKFQYATGQRVLSLWQHPNGNDWSTMFYEGWYFGKTADGERAIVQFLRDPKRYEIRFEKTFPKMCLRCATTKTSNWRRHHCHTCGLHIKPELERETRLLKKFERLDSGKGSDSEGGDGSGNDSDDQDEDDDGEDEVIDVECVLEDTVRRIGSGGTGGRAVGGVRPRRSTAGKPPARTAANAKRARAEAAARRKEKEDKRKQPVVTKSGRQVQQARGYVIVSESEEESDNDIELFVSKNSSGVVTRGKRAAGSAITVKKRGVHVMSDDTQHYVRASVLKSVGGRIPRADPTIVYGVNGGQYEAYTMQQVRDVNPSGANQRGLALEILQRICDLVSEETSIITVPCSAWDPDMPGIVPTVEHIPRTVSGSLPPPRDPFAYEDYLYAPEDGNDDFGVDKQRVDPDQGFYGIDYAVETRPFVERTDALASRYDDDDDDDDDDDVAMDDARDKDAALDLLSLRPQHQRGPDTSLDDLSDDCDYPSIEYDLYVPQYWLLLHDWVVPEGFPTFVHSPQERCGKVFPAFSLQRVRDHNPGLTLGELESVTIRVWRDRAGRFVQMLPSCREVRVWEAQQREERLKHTFINPGWPLDIKVVPGRRLVADRSRIKIRPPEQPARGSVIKHSLPHSALKRPRHYK